MYTIYALVDPRDHTTRYIGIAGDVYTRFKQHLRKEGSNPAKHAWIAELERAQQMVLMVTLEQVETLEEALKQEVSWIQRYLVIGAPLLNHMGVPTPAQTAGPPQFVRSTSERLRKVYLLDKGTLVPLTQVSNEVFHAFIARHVNVESIEVPSWRASGQRCQVINFARKQGIALACYDREGRVMYL
ncbi:MAG: GIY-YIG nuclease family protein [Ktedonobacteraceae bacterium]|nr:GIY-YIG nuclease family protein [Ktedonobacteraceae bacterium]